MEQGKFAINTGFFETTDPFEGLYNKGFSQ
jgi:hypothetical protein